MSDANDTTTFFLWAGLALHQHEQVHKIGTDAILLGSWIPQIISSAESILDIGTGTGILALIMAKAHPEAKIKAIDINDNALLLAQRNVQASGYGDRITIVEEDILKAFRASKKYDLVMSNPPYYTTQNPTDNMYKKMAKHMHGSIEDWMYKLLESTADHGCCCIIVPSNTAQNWIRAANHQKFYNTNRMDVYSFDIDPSPVRTLLCFRHALQKPNLSRLTIYQSDNTYSKQYLTFTGIAKEGSQKANRNI